LARLWNMKLYGNIHSLKSEVDIRGMKHLKTVQREISDLTFDKSEIINTRGQKGQLPKIWKLNHYQY